MKAISLNELQTFVQELNQLEGAQLQEVSSFEDGLALGFWNHGMTWVIFDLRKACPFAVLLKENPFLKMKQSSPLGLFMKAHFHNMIFDCCEVQADYGRVLKLFFHRREEEAEMEAIFIPHQPNLIAYKELKRVSWNKPQLLQPHAEIPPPHERTFSQMQQEWQESRFQGLVTGGHGEVQKQLDKKKRALEQKQKALESLQKLIEKPEYESWMLKGEALKTGQGEVLDPEKNLAWNIEECFRLAKLSKKKWESQKLRREILQNEIIQLQASDLSKPTGPSLLRQADAQGRTLHLVSGISAFMGKSAADNLSLLRQAKAWDLWMHVKDYPGAHVIIRKDKQKSVSDDDLLQIAQWLIQQGVGRGKTVLGTYSVLVTECRYVRPLKGDKLGRVTHQNAREIAVSCF